MRIAMRAAAVAIAVAALIDPAWSSTRDAGRELIAIMATKTTGGLERLRAAANGWALTMREASGPSLPCAPGERCVLIADGSLDVDIPADIVQPISLIAEKPTGEPNVELRRVGISSTHASAAGSARVELIRTGAVAATEIRITDGAAIVGTATHEWDKESTASVEVPWWPIETGGRVLRIEAVPVDGEISATDNTIDVGVDVARARVPVVVFDARPSWASTFVRRALEDDPRFTVGHRSRVAPSLTAGTTGTQLDEPVLDQAAVLIIGGPDALTSSDVTVIDRFVRVRGGTLVLLPEQQASGPSEALFPGTWTEHLSQAIEAIGPLYASEVLRSHDSPLDTVLGRSASRPAIVSSPVGNGRVVVSGAMDAWRHRDRDAGAFDRFWRSVVAEGAIAGVPLAVTFDQRLAASGARVELTIRVRRMRPATTSVASAVMRCGDQPASVIRLRPAGTVGMFTGEASAAVAGACAVDAVVDGRQASASVAVAERPRRGSAVTLTKMVNAVARTRGTVVNAGDEAALIAALERNRQPSSQVVSTRPMRSPWWMIPFAACLTVEWWLRRRDGLR